MKAKIMAKDQIRQFVGLVVDRVVVDRWFDGREDLGAVGLNIVFLDGSAFCLWCAGNGDIGVSEGAFFATEKCVFGDSIAWLSGGILQIVEFLNDGVVLGFNVGWLRVKNDCDELMIERLRREIFP